LLQAWETIGWCRSQAPIEGGKRMETLRVHVGEMPRMARDITTRALQNLGSAVLDAPRDPAAMRPAGGGHPPILIVAARGERLGPYEQDLLAAMPDAVIVLFDETGRSIAKYELWPRRSTLGELSVEAIADAVSTASSWGERFRD
jgi:hypothetical protein